MQRSKLKINFRRKKWFSFTKTDKGGAALILDVENYIEKANKELNNENYYEKPNCDATKEHTQVINDTVKAFQRH